MYRIVCIIPIVIFLHNMVAATTNKLATLPHNRIHPSILKNVNTYRTPTQISTARFKRVNLTSEDAAHARRKLRFD